MIIIQSTEERFHECLEEAMKKHGIDFLHSYDDDTCLDLARQHPEAIVVVDAHSYKPIRDCSALHVVEQMLDAHLPNRALMLSREPRSHVLQHTSQKDNKSLHIKYQNSGQYVFRQMPISESELLEIILSNPQQP